MNIVEANRLDVKKGDYVLVRLPHPATATIDEIVAEFIHAGEVLDVYHTENGVLRVEVEGLQARLGREWTWQNRIEVVDRCKQSIFGDDENFIEATIFDIKFSYGVNGFSGDIAEIGDGEFEVYSYDSGNSYIVKTEEISKNSYKIGCTCPDFTHRLRVCKHIKGVFCSDRTLSQKLAA